MNDDSTYKSVPSGPLVAFDVDDTLILWNTPQGMEDKEIEIKCNGVISSRVPNIHHINLLKKFYESGHIVMVWSGSGVRWCESVIKALKIEKYVHICISKPTYYIDDISDPKKWIGKHSFIDINGKIKGQALHAED